jgi:hypothetical protein
MREAPEADRQHGAAMRRRIIQRRLQPSCNTLRYFVSV